MSLEQLIQTQKGQNNFLKGGIQYSNFKLFLEVSTDVIHYKYMITSYKIKLLQLPLIAIFPLHLEVLQFDSMTMD